MKAALRAGAIDMPGKAGTDSARHLHKKPTPRMGGLAIFVGFVCSALLFAPLGPKNISMLAGATMIVLLGVFDDIYDLPAMKKLVVQLAAAAVAVLGGNKIYFFSRLMSLGGHWVYHLLRELGHHRPGLFQSRCGHHHQRLGRGLHRLPAL